MAENNLSRLFVSIEEADKEIQERIEIGQQLRDQEIHSHDELEGAIMDFHNWSEYNEKFLLRLFDNSSVVDEYNRPYEDKERWDTYDLAPNIDYYRYDVTTKIKRLGGICDQLVLLEEPSDTPQPTSNIEEVSDISQPTFSNDVFIVHGHDQAAKHAVARFVEGLGLNTIILDEQANRGQTIIDKFEENADATGFAIILLTPDDVGASSDKPAELQPRARQNVILELGYFWGKLGREHTCVFYKEEVELPSDIRGISYVSIDNPNEWQLQLAREMQQAGLPIDLEKFLSNR